MYRRHETTTSKKICAWRILAEPTSNIYYVIHEHDRSWYYYSFVRVSVAAAIAYGWHVYEYDACVGTE